MSPLGNAEQQLDALSHPHMAPRQKQLLAQQIGQVQGNEQVQRVIQRDWLTDPFGALGNAIGDALDMRENEAALDEWEDYQASQDELHEFMAEPHTTEKFQSTTNLGLFDAVYNPGKGTLKVTVRCKFNFVSGSPTTFPTASAEDLAWKDQQEMDDWQNSFLSTVSTKWTEGNLEFHCQKDWWEHLKAKVEVEAIAVSEDEHFALTISKVPPGGASPTSSVRAPVRDENGEMGVGTGTFDSRDLEEVTKVGGNKMVPAVHEMGHMLGLDDEYEASSGTPQHNELVESEFGHGVAKSNDNRLMATGSDIQPEHGVTFLEALRDATNMSEWASSPVAAPRPKPSNPHFEGMGDFPMPDSDVRTV